MAWDRMAWHDGAWTLIDQADCAGELAVQAKLGSQQAVANAYEAKEPMDSFRQQWFCSLQTLPFATLDADNRPWASILTGPAGGRDFIQPALGNAGLRIAAKVQPGDPIGRNLAAGASGGLFAGVGVEHLNRRRNKIAGVVKSVERRDGLTEITAEVDETLGNCPVRRISALVS